MAKKRIMPMQPTEYDRLKAALERERNLYCRDKRWAQVGSLQAVCDFLMIHGIPKRLLVPLIDLEKTMLNAMPGGNPRDTLEASLLAKAQAAITIGMRKDAYGSVADAAQQVSVRVPQRLGWTPDFLMNHRKNHKRLNPDAYELYESTVEARDHWSEWKRYSNKDKADALIKAICDFS